MFFKKKRKKEENPILYNIEGNAYFNTSTGEFLLPFDYEQKKYMIHAMNSAYNQYIGTEIRRSHNFRPIAMPEIPAGVMQSIMSTLYENDRGREFLAFKELRIQDIDIWKVAKLFSTLPEKEWDKIPAFVSCLWFGVKIWEEIPDFTRYNRDVFVAVFGAASCGANICDEIHPGMDFDKIDKKVKAMYEQKEIKAAKKELSIAGYEVRYIKKAKK